MSFRVDLWNGFNVIKNQFTSTINKITNLCEFFISYAGYEKIYYKNLENLYKENKDLFEDSNYLLDKNLILLINNIKSESEYHREFYKYIKHDLIESLKEIAEKQKTVINNLFEEGMLNEDNFNKIKNNLIEKQKAYNHSLKEFYDYISTLKEEELNSMFENEKMQDSGINISERYNNFKMANTVNVTDISTIYNEDFKSNKQQINKKEKLIEKIRQSRDEYNCILNKSNIYLELYKKKAEGVLQFLEEKYHIIISNIHSYLVSTVDHKIDLINKLNQLYRSFLEIGLRGFNIKKEAEEFIIKNVTKEFPIYKFEFISNNYDNKDNFTSVDVNNYLRERLDNEPKNQGTKKSKSHKKNEIKRHIKRKNFSSTKDVKISMLTGDNPVNDEMNDYKIKTNICFIEDFIEELINNNIEENEEEKKDPNKLSFIDSSSKMMEISNIKPLLDKDNDHHIKYLDILFKTFNINRAKGNFVINEKSYNIISDIFIYVLDNFPNNDFVLKNVIILSQTFYKNDNSDNEKIGLSKEKKKIFVQDRLKKNPIFSNPETWHRVINCNLAGNVNNKDISLPVDKNEINKKLDVLVFNILIAYLTDIKYFTDDQTLFDDIKNFYVRIYNLDAEKVNNEINLIMNYSSAPKKKKGISFSLDNNKKE